MIPKKKISLLIWIRKLINSMFDYILLNSIIPNTFHGGSDVVVFVGLSLNNGANVWFAIFNPAPIVCATGCGIIDATFAATGSNLPITSYPLENIFLAKSPIFRKMPIAIFI